MLVAVLVSEYVVATNLSDDLSLYRCLNLRAESCGILAFHLMDRSNAFLGCSELWFRECLLHFEIASQVSSLVDDQVILKFAERLLVLRYLMIVYLSVLISVAVYELFQLWLLQIDLCIAMHSCCFDLQQHCR